MTRLLAIAFAAAVLGGTPTVGAIEQQAVKVETAQKQLDRAAGQPPDQKALTPLETIRTDLQKGDLDAAMLALQRERAQLLDAQLRDMLAALRSRNDEIAKLERTISELLQQRNEATARTACGTPDVNACIRMLRERVDALNSQSQLDMIRIQSLANKRNDAFNVLASMLSKFEKTNEGAIPKLR